MSSSTTFRSSLSHSASDTSFKKSLPSSSHNNNNNGDDIAIPAVSSTDDVSSIQQQQGEQIPNGNSNQPTLTLLQAVISGDVRKVRKMVVKGVSAAEANERDPQGRTPLSIACANGMVLTVEFLSFIPEIDPNKCDNEGNTPLILAAQAGNVDCVRILLKEFRNVKLDHQNRKGYTALIQAAINGRTDCAKILMEAGANPFFADKVRKKNALQWAEFCGRGPCAAVIKEMSGRFPALVRHLVQAGQSVLTRHRSIWGSDGEIDRIAEREQLAAKSQGATSERRGTISRLLQRSAKWIRSLSKRRKPSYKSLGALVSVGLAISGPAVTKQILDKSQLAEEENNRKKAVTRLGSGKGNRHGPQSPPWRIPEVQIIAPADEFCPRFSGSPASNINNSTNVSSSTPQQQTSVSPAINASQNLPQQPDVIVIDTDTNNIVGTIMSGDCSSETGGNINNGNNRSVIITANEAWGQHASAPTSPVLSSRSAERAHRRRFAQRAAATTSRQHGYHHQAGPTAYSFAYHDTVLAAAEHLNEIAAAAEQADDGNNNDEDNDDDLAGPGSSVITGTDSAPSNINQAGLGGGDESLSIGEEEEEENDFYGSGGSSTNNNPNNLIFTYETTNHNQSSPTTTKKPY